MRTPLRLPPARARLGDDSLSLERLDDVANVVDVLILAEKRAFDARVPEKILGQTWRSGNEKKRTARQNVSGLRPGFCVA